VKQNSLNANVEATTNASVSGRDGSRTPRAMRVRERLN